jgi:hypothetical protein
MKKEIPKKLIKKTKKWLRKEGITFFREIKAKHGEVDAVWVEYEKDEFGRNHKIPRTIHFQQGMQVRNFMRYIRLKHNELCEGWDDHDFDDNWADLIEECIK